MARNAYKTAYNQPPPWDPGYALPQNVQDEGLQDRGFVTKWAPRGTYDHTPVNSGGYALPGYVADEVYGQGTLTTSWMRRGTAPSVTHWLNARPQVSSQRKLAGGGVKLAFSGLGSVDVSSGHVLAGRKSAAEILTHVGRLPSARRAPAMRGILDSVDPQLRNHVERLTRERIHAGVQPTLAFHSALSIGLAQAAARQGRTGSHPKVTSSVGAGRYALASLGDAMAKSVTMSSPALLATIATNAQAVDPQHPCGGYSWDGSIGAWVRTRAGQPDTPGPGGTCPTVTVTDNRGDGGVNAASAQATQRTIKNLASMQAIQIGPFMLAFDGDVGKVSMPPSMMSPEQKSAFETQARAATKSLLQKIAFSNMPGTATASYHGFPARKMVTGYGVKSAPQTVVPGGSEDSLNPGIYDSELVINGTVPIWKFKHPTTGAAMGLYVSSIGTADKPRILFFTRKLPKSKSLLGWIWSGIKWLVAKVVGFVVDVIKGLAGLACDIAGSKYGVVVGAGIGAAAGSPQAGVAAAQIGASLCAGTTDVALPPPPPPLQNGLLLPLAIAGGAVALVLVMHKKGS